MLTLIFGSGCTQPTGQASLSSTPNKSYCPYECCEGLSQYMDKDCLFGGNCIVQKCVQLKAVEDKTVGKAAVENSQKACQEAGSGQAARELPAAEADNGSLETGAESPKCSEAYLSEYRCSGDWVERKYLNADCNYDWAREQLCQFGCETGKCKQGCEAGYLDEFKCNQNNIDRAYQYADCNKRWLYAQHCTYGCSGGQCNPKPQESTPQQPTCIDSDNGADYYVKGCVTHGTAANATECDKCDSSLGYANYVVEYYCVGTGWGFANHKCPYGCSDGKCNSSSQGVTVSAVIDGDTVKLSSGESVRLIGINTPESGQQCYTEAKSKLTDMVLQKEIRLEKDVEDKDQYGRLLRYIYVGNLFVNLEMVKSGYAAAYPYGENAKYDSEFSAAQEQAQQNHIGCMWPQASANYIKDKCLSVQLLHYDAAGNDNYNLNDEYVEIKNNCNYDIGMVGWTIKDTTSRADHIYTFPSFTLNQSAAVTLYTGQGANTATDLYWGRAMGNYAAIWNNDGDTLYMRDAQGNLVLVYAYS